MVLSIIIVVLSTVPLSVLLSLNIHRSVVAVDQYTVSADLRTCCARLVLWDSALIVFHELGRISGICINKKEGVGTMVPNQDTIPSMLLVADKIEKG